MARTPWTVDGRVAQARAARDRSAAQVRAASQARLADLLRLSPQAQFAHLDDPALVPDDRRALLQAIEKGVPASSWRMPRRLWRRRWISQRMRRRALRVAFEPLVACPALILIACTGLAWHNTAVSVRLNQDVPFKMVAPNGRQGGTFEQGGIVPAFLDRRGGAVLRHWFPRIGYALVPVPLGSFSVPSADEVRAAQQASRYR